MKITGNDGNQWVIRRRWWPWRLRLLRWSRLGSPFEGATDVAGLVVAAALLALIALPAMIEVLAAAAVLPIVVVLRLAGTMTTTVEVRHHWRPRLGHRTGHVAPWSSSVRGWRCARHLRNDLAVFMRGNGIADIEWFMAHWEPS